MTAETTGQSGYWQLDVEMTAHTIALETALEAVLDVQALSSHKSESGYNQLQAWFDTPPDRELIEHLITASVDADKLQCWQISEVSGRDWLAENRKSFPPLLIDRFWIYGSHVNDAPPAGTLPLLVDAAQAFGSGTHPTTRACLHLLHDFARHRPAPRRILDMGCGSAILAMAAHRLFKASQIIAADADIRSVEATRLNRRLNHISPRQLKAVHSLGFAHPDTRSDAPYDLIFANILAGPLRQLSAPLSRHLSPSGRLILSGLLSSQTQSVLSAYHARNMMAEDILTLGDWTAIILKHRRRG